MAKPAYRAYTVIKRENKDDYCQVGSTAATMANAIQTTMPNISTRVETLVRMNAP